MILLETKKFHTTKSKRPVQ